MITGSIRAHCSSDKSLGYEVRSLTPQAHQTTPSRPADSVQAHTIRRRQTLPKPHEPPSQAVQLSGGTSRTGESYSAYNQLTSITAGGTAYTAEYGGTANADRTRLGQTAFHRGPLGLAATTTSGTDTGFVREPTGTLNSVTRDGKSYYYLTDAIGTVVALTDASGNKVNSYYYSPRGVTKPTERITQPYRYAGAYQDPTGLYKMGARYYDTRTGRFTQPDPSGQETNPYLYAAGDYINRTDPNGLWSWASLGEGIGGAAGGVLGLAATAAVCSTGIGCVAVAIVFGALGTGSGAAIGSAIGGGSPQDRANAFQNGLLGGALGGSGLKFGLARFFR